METDYPVKESIIVLGGGFIGVALGQLTSLYWARDKIPFLISLVCALFGAGFGILLVSRYNEQIEKWYKVIGMITLVVLILFVFWMAFLIYVGFGMFGPH